MTQGFNKIHRQLLITLCSLPIICWLKTTWSTPDQDYALASSLTNIFKDRSSARIIGALYLKIVPDEADIQQLLGCLCSDHPELEALAENSHAALSNRIRALQNEDFDRERVINLDGWILSRTEARLCALTTFI